jgi:polyphosphate kinase
MTKEELEKRYIAYKQWGKDNVNITYQQWLENCLLEELNGKLKVHLPDVIQSLPINKTKLWEMAQTISDKQKFSMETEIKSDQVMWDSNAKDWFDWLEDELKEAMLL